MIKCKYCGTELPDDAVFCDNCGKRVVTEPEPEEALQQNDSGRSGAERSEKNKTVSNIVFLIMLMIIAVTVFAVIRYINTPWEYEDDYYDNENRVTVEQYESIQRGATYDEIAEAIGSPGYDYDVNVYRWPGEYYSDIFSYCEFTFDENGVLISKAENDLIDGAQIIDDMEKTAAVIDTKTADKIRKGMSLAEVEELFGGRGTLQSSRSDDTGRITRMYWWNISDDETLEWGPDATPGDEDWNNGSYDWYYETHISVEFNEKDMVSYWEVW